MSKHKWQLVTEYGLREYRCGLRAGENVRVKREIVIRDHRGKPTGEVHPVGEIWAVLSGVAAEPHVIWLREPNGDRHTWDEDTFFGTFEIVSHAKA
jgi:hypothetical protein